MQEQEANQKVNMIYDMCRDIIKMEDGQERHNKISELLSIMSSVGVNTVENSGDPRMAVALHFGGFSSIAMMLGAVDLDDPKTHGSFINFVQVCVGMSTNALQKSEERAAQGVQDGEEKE